MSFEASLKVGAGAYTYYPVSEIEGAAQLPYSLTVLLENVLRCGRTPEEAQAMAERIVTAGLAGQTGEEVEFSPARVLFQDFTGVPVFVDFAVMREACADLGGDPTKINPAGSLRPRDRPFGHRRRRRLRRAALDAEHGAGVLAQQASATTS